MANERTSIDIETPVQDVWGLVTDLDRLGEWVSIHRDLPDPPPKQVQKCTRSCPTLAVASSRAETTRGWVTGGSVMWPSYGPAWLRRSLVTSNLRSTSY